MKKCSFCGTENQDNSAFCELCGRRFERELEEKKEAELKERVTKQVEKSTEYYSTTQKKKGKLASKAGMVQQYNEKSEKKNRK